jgi:hypothetical protein
MNHALLRIMNHQKHLLPLNVQQGSHSLPGFLKRKVSFYQPALCYHKDQTISYPVLCKSLQRKRDLVISTRLCLLLVGWPLHRFRIANFCKKLPFLQLIFNNKTVIGATFQELLNSCATTVFGTRSFSNTFRNFTMKRDSFLSLELDLICC